MIDELKDTDEHTEAIARAASLLRASRYAIALTGAGSSTPSGIPDFRSPESGMWSRFDPMEVASLRSFRRDPNRFYAWIRPMIQRLMTAEPNPAHRALAKMEADGYLKAVITQNIDDLHQKAGSQEVLELHGHMREATCLRCYQATPTTQLLGAFLQDSELPLCEACGGLMKPNVVLFGEQLPAQEVARAMAHVRRADLMLVVGSSLLVAPASQLPLLVYEQAGALIVVNLSKTYLDDVADVLIHGDVADVLPRIATAAAAAAAAAAAHPHRDEQE